MTRVELRALVEKYLDQPSLISNVICCRDAEIEEGFKILFHSPYPNYSMHKRIEILIDILENDRQFYFSLHNEVPNGAKYVCDVGVCDAGKLYIK